MGLLDRIAPRRSEVEAAVQSRSADAAVFSTKALTKFLATLTSRETPSLLDLGPVVGSNVSFFGEQLGCKIFVEDIYADVDRHNRQGKLEELPEFLGKRFQQEDGSVDGILCWDLIDYLDKPSAQVLATQLMRLLRPEGALLAFFGTAQPRDNRFTKYIVVDAHHLKYRPYDAARGRRNVLLNRDIIRLFEGLKVTESFLLQNNIRETLFRKTT